LELALPVIHGVHAALVTPRRADANEIDFGAALDLVDFACRSGLDGIVLSGSTGEFVHFDIGERLKLMRLAIKRSRVPVTVNVSHSSLEGALALAREALSQGAAALLLMPPHFFPYGQPEIQEFYLRFARAAGSSIPVLLYNIPAFTSPIHFDTLAHLLATGLYAGVKDSSGNLEGFRSLKTLRARSPFTLLIGADGIFTRAREEGADGAISGVASALPELLVGLEKAISRGATQKRDELDARLQEFLVWIARFPFPFGIKEAVNLRGPKTGPHALPPSAEMERTLGEFREWFRGWLPEVLKETAGA
jgi:dihydrodipicolinate synthase/N-acetylneuraminate lyase